MYKDLKVRLINSLKAEADYVSKFEMDKTTKFDKMNDIMNLTKVLVNFEELEPIIANCINEKAKKEKFREER